MFRIISGFAPLVVLGGIAVIGVPVRAQPSPVGAISPAAERRQLEAARKELSQSLSRIQKCMDELPEAAEPLQRVEAELSAQMLVLDRRIAALAPPDKSAAPQVRPAGNPRPRREIAFSVDTRIGFNRRSVIAPALASGSGSSSPLLVKRDVQWFLLYTVFTGEYPLSGDATATLVLPYLRQSLRSSALGQSTTRRGSGLGDVALYLERRFTEIAPGAELSVAAGMQFPTGKDPFHLKPRELPTGLGYYQPTFRATLQKMLIPIQVFGTVEYSTAFSRKIAGEKVRLPDSYGGEIGFAYTIGPEFVARTSASLRRENAPYLLGPGVTVGYLSQSLLYRTGGRSSFRGSLDVGLTEDSFDYLLGLDLTSAF